MLKNLFGSFGNKGQGPAPAPAKGLSSSSGTMSLGVSVKEDGQGNVLLSVLPPETGPAPKLDICLVIDTSGSMGDAANPNGSEEVKLFSKMDLAKRGAEVITRALGPADTLTVFGFQSTVTKVLPRTAMDAHGMDTALAAIAALQPYGGTALWDGLHAGLYELETDAASAKGHDSTRLAVVILLTDGLPSPSPPAGEIAELQKYLAARDAAIHRGDEKRAAAKLVTMGFGYDVNSKLLLDLANTHGSGAGNDFAFIPDGTMLLTTFVNLMANLQSTCARKAVMRVVPGVAHGSSAGAAGAAAPPADVAAKMDAAFSGMSLSHSNPAAAANNSNRPVNIPSLVSVTGETVWKPLPLSQSPGQAAAHTGLELHLGDVMYGQPRQVVLRPGQGVAAAAVDWRSWVVDLAYEPMADGFTAVDVTQINYDGSTPSASNSNSNSSQGGGLSVMDVPLVTQQLHRALCISAIAHVSRVAGVDLTGAQAAVKDAALAAMALQEAPHMAGLAPHAVLEDLLGQVSEAVGSKEAWGRWGGHYLRSLLGAHKAQACNNFKDPGVLAYGGAHTIARRDALNAMCDSLPVPVPSIQPQGTAWGTPYASGAPVTVSASAFRDAFNNRYGGCFGPGTMVALADGSTKPVERLRKGDLVAVPASAGAGSSACTAAKVACVVTYSGVQTVRLPGSGLSITPWHPVRVPTAAAAGSGYAWRFPADLLAEAAAATPGMTPAALAATAFHSPPAVYNLVLESGHVVVVDGVEAVTLGHGFTDDAIVAHPFFGTEAVVEELRALPGWEAGWVDLGAAAKQIMGQERRALASASASASASGAVAAGAHSSISSSGVQLDPATGLVCSLLPQTAASC